MTFWIEHKKSIIVVFVFYIIDFDSYTKKLFSFKNL